MSFHHQYVNFLAFECSANSIIDFLLPKLSVLPPYCPRNIKNHAASRVLTNTNYFVDHRYREIIVRLSFVWFVVSELYPRSRCLYMYRDVVKVAKSIYRLSCTMPSVRLAQLMGRLSGSLCARVRDWIGYGGDDFNILIENDLTYGATNALVTMRAYLDFRRQGFDIKAIRYEDLIARPLETCQRLMEACGLSVSLAQDAVRCMQTDSQHQTSISRAALERFQVPEVTPEVKTSLDRLAAVYGLPPVSQECVLEGTIS